MQIRIPGPVPHGLTVFETMRAEADGRINLWPLHLERLRRGCVAVGFPLDEQCVAQRVATLPRGAVLRARLSVDATGQVALSHTILKRNPAFWRVVLSDRRLYPEDPWLAIKSSYRPVYEAARADLPEGIDEALLMNTRGEICEGTITSVFLRRADRLLTPAHSCGVLPGVLRESLLREGYAEEVTLRPSDLLSGELWCGNALRGLIPARLLPAL